MHKLSYKLSSNDILKFIFRVHGLLVILPLAFLMGGVALIIGGYDGFEVFFCFLLLCISVLLIAYVFLSGYYLTKKQYYFRDEKTEYCVEFDSSLITFYQGKGEYQTEYTWSDFFKCLETKTTFYFYFKYNKALIVKKDKFIVGNLEDLRTLIKENIPTVAGYLT